MKVRMMNNSKKKFARVYWVDDFETVTPEM